MRRPGHRAGDPQSNNNILLLSIRGWCHFMNIHHPSHPSSRQNPQSPKHPSQSSPRATPQPSQTPIHSLPRGRTRPPLTPLTPPQMPPNGIRLLIINRLIHIFSFNNKHSINIRIPFGCIWGGVGWGGGSCEHFGEAKRYKLQGLWGPQKCLDFNRLQKPNTGEGRF